MFHFEETLQVPDKKQYGIASKDVRDFEVSAIHTGFILVWVKAQITSFLGNPFVCGAALKGDLLTAINHTHFLRVRRAM